MHALQIYLDRNQRHSCLTLYIEIVRINSLDNICSAPREMSAHLYMCINTLTVEGIYLHTRPYVLLPAVWHTSNKLLRKPLLMSANQSEAPPTYYYSRESKHLIFCCTVATMAAQVSFLAPGALGPYPDSTVTNQQIWDHRNYIAVHTQIYNLCLLKDVVQTSSGAGDLVITC